MQVAFLLLFYLEIHEGSCVLVTFPRTKTCSRKRYSKTTIYVYMYDLFHCLYDKNGVAGDICSSVLEESYFAYQTFLAYKQL